MLLYSYLHAFEDHLHIDDFLRYVRIPFIAPTQAILSCAFKFSVISSFSANCFTSRSNICPVLNPYRVAVQLAAETQSSMQHRTMLLDIRRYFLPHIPISCASSSSSTKQGT